MKDFFNGMGKGAGVIVGVIIAIVILCCGCGITAGILSKNEDKPKKVNQTTTQATNTTQTTNTDATNTEEPAEELQSEYAVGDIVEYKDMKITYISAGEYSSDNQFLQPEEGNVYYKADFEFENIGSDDKAISSMVGWNCYADGYLVNQKFLDTDNDLSGTISNGKKVKGSLFFEVPASATDITLEYEDNVFLNNKIVFRIK